MKWRMLANFLWSSYPQIIRTCTMISTSGKYFKVILCILNGSSFGQWWCRSGPPGWPGGDDAWRAFRAGEPVNAHSHLIAMLTGGERANASLFILHLIPQYLQGTSESIPINVGSLKIGTYQNIMVVCAFHFHFARVFLDLCALLESGGSGQSGTWIVNGVSYGRVYDGTHPSSSGYVIGSACVTPQSFTAI